MRYLCNMTNNTTPIRSGNSVLDSINVHLTEDETFRTRVEPFPHRGQTWHEVQNARGIATFRVCIFHDDLRIVVHSFDDRGCLAGSVEFSGGMLATVPEFLASIGY